LTHSENEDLVQLLITDHREVEELFRELEGLAGSTGDEVGTLAERVVIELVRHSVAEEMYLYPTTREHVPGGAKLADQEISEHAQAERTMKELERLEPGDAQFWPTLHTLMTEIRSTSRRRSGTCSRGCRTRCRRTCWPTSAGRPVPRRSWRRPARTRRHRTPRR